MKAVMLTGATGFIGSHLAEELLAGEAPVHLFVRRRTSLIDHYERHGAHVYLADLHNIKAIGKSIRDAHTVIHCAGATKALREKDYFEANLDFTKNILSCLEPGQRIVYISSQAAAGPSPLSATLDEDSEPGPVSYYGKSKLEAEKAVRAWAEENGGDYAILRPGIVYGPREKELFRFFKSIQKGFLPVLGKGSKKFSVLYVEDLVRAVLSALDKSTGRKVYFVSNDTPCTWDEMGNTIRYALGKKNVIKIPVPEGLAGAVALASDTLSFITHRPSLISRQKLLEAKQPAWICRNHRIKKDLAWEPEYSLKEGIRKTAEWYVKAGWI